MALLHPRRTFDTQAWEACMAAAWEVVAAEELARPLTQAKPYEMLAESLGRIKLAEARQERLAGELLGQRDDHVVMDGGRFSRAYVEATMQDFNWALMDRPGTYPWAFVQKWPDLRAHAEAHLAELARQAERDRPTDDRVTRQRSTNFANDMLCPPHELPERERRLQQLWKAWGFPVHPDTPSRGEQR